MSETPASGVSAIVLAAGSSTRMGTPKQLLRIGGKALLEIVLETLAQSQVGEIIVVLGASAEAILQEVKLGAAKGVINEAYREGMGTSLRTGLASVDPRARAALVVLADQPFLRASTIDRLIDQHREHAPQVALPLYRGFRGNPVLLDRSVFAELANLSGDVGCRAIFGSHTENILKVPLGDPGILLDLDTRGDFESIRANGPGPEPPILETAGVLANARPQLVIVGWEDVGRALLQLGCFLRFTVALVDPFQPLAQTPGADCVLHSLDSTLLPPSSGRYVVIASRGRFDEEAIEQAVCARADYIALVSNQKRAREVLGSLRSRGMAAGSLSAVRAPAGLPIGAENPEEIALSVMAEIVAERHRRRTG